jgi:hypothetical protein
MLIRTLKKQLKISELLIDDSVMEALNQTQIEELLEETGKIQFYFSNLTPLTLPRIEFHKTY